MTHTTEQIERVARLFQCLYQANLFKKKVWESCSHYEQAAFRTIAEDHLTKMSDETHRLRAALVKAVGILDDELDYRPDDEAANTYAEVKQALKPL